MIDAYYWCIQIISMKKVKITNYSNVKKWKYYIIQILKSENITLFKWLKSEKITR